MKLTKDYTGQELENLTDDQVTRLIDWECAEEGVPFAPDDPPTYTPVAAEKDIRAWKVGNTGILCKTQADAQTIADFLGKFDRWNQTYDYLLGYNDVMKPCSEELIVSVEDGYSLAKMRERVEVIKRDKKDKEYYEAAKKKWDSVVGSRGRIADWTWERIWKAREFRQEREHLHQQLERCIELADGNREIGLRFFKKSNDGWTAFLTIEGNEVSDKHYDNPDGPCAESAQQAEQEVEF